MLNKEIKEKFDRMCVACGRNIKITLYTDKTYKGGQYFNIKIPKVDQEYWECNRCFNKSKQ